MPATDGRRVNLEEAANRPRGADGAGPTRTAVALIVAATVAVATYLTFGVLGQQGWGGGVYWAMLASGAAVLGVGTWLTPRVRVRHALPVVIVGAALMRVVLVPLEPALSTDMYRYLWDGQVQASGINPYVHAPEDPALEELRDDLWEPINRKFARTIYPPVAQLTFLGANLVGLDTTTGWKALVSLADLAAIVLLVVVLTAAGRDPRRVVAYAWNPLPIMAFGLSGHVDAFVVLAAVAATLLWWRGRHLGAGALIGVAAGVKLFPLMLVAAFARGRDTVWRWGPAIGQGVTAVGVLLAGYLLYLSAGTDVFGYLTTGYLDEEGYTTADRFRLVRALGLDGRVVTPIVAVAVGIAVLRSHRPAPTRAAWLMGAAFVLTVPFSWYTAPLIALAVAGGAGWAWGWFAILLHAAYIAIFHDDVLAFLTGGMRLSTPLRNIAAGAIVLLAIAAVRSRWARRAVIWQPPEDVPPAAAGASPRPWDASSGEPPTEVPGTEADRP